MAEKGNTSSMTSVTEDDSSPDSESDTTESSYSNITSSVLSSTDTDDKLTPSLCEISISANTEGSGQMNECVKNVPTTEAKSEVTNLHHNDSSSFIRKQNFSSHPLKRAARSRKQRLKNKNLLHSVLCRSDSALNTNNNAACEENLGVEDKDNKLSTDFSDTSSVAVADDYITKTWLNGREEGEEEEGQNGINDSDLSTEASNLEDRSNEGQLDAAQSWEPDMTSSNWYQAPCFDRYWSHYSFVMAWYRAHMDAVHRLHRNPSMQTWGRGRTLGMRQPRVGAGHQVLSHGQGQSNGQRLSRRARRARSRRNAKAKRRAGRSVSGSASDQVDDGRSSGVTGGPKDRSARVDKNEAAEEAEEEEEMEMEITDDMMAFFTTSLKHRMERDTAKAGEDGASEKNAPETRVNIEDATVGQCAPTTAPPQERPGARRALEMKQLYGDGAAMIHGMETALQMTFDRTQDKFQTKLWPNMPLKIIFG